MAERNGVQLNRESSLLVTDLFPADVAKGKDVLLIYKGATARADVRIGRQRVGRAPAAPGDMRQHATGRRVAASMNSTCPVATKAMTA